MDVTILEAFNAIDVPEHLRQDVNFFVAVAALLETSDGKKAIKTHRLVQFFHSCFYGYDEEESGLWAARDYAMKIIGRHKGPMIADKNDKKKKPASTQKRNHK